jgi:hypothetical protein
MGYREEPRNPWHVVWVLVSSVIWAAVIVSTGDVGWPLVVWALTTFAPLAERNRKRSAEMPE